MEADLAAITAIYGQAVGAGTGSLELVAPDVTMMTRRWQKRVGKGLPYLVATSGDAVVGYAYASRHRTSEAYRFLVEDSVFVTPAAQGNGVGRALLDALIRRCEALAYRQMIALIADANAPSVRLHEHCGFRQIGLLAGSAFKHGHWIDTLLMQRSLGDGDASPPPADQKPAMP